MSVGITVDAFYAVVKIRICDEGKLFPIQASQIIIVGRFMFSLNPENSVEQFKLKG